MSEVKGRLVVKGRGGPIYLEMHMEKTMRVKFKKEQMYETQGRMQGTTYQRDQVCELPEDQANKWINRGVAEVTDEKVSKADYEAPPVDENYEPSDDFEEELTRVRRAPNATTHKDVGKK